MSPLHYAPLPKSLQRYHKPVLVDLGVFDEWTNFRDSTGELVTIDWGKPDEDGTYTPTFTRHDDGMVLISRAVLDVLEERAGGRE